MCGMWWSIGRWCGLLVVDYWLLFVVQSRVLQVGCRAGRRASPPFLESKLFAVHLFSAEYFLKLTVRLGCSFAFKSRTDCFGSILLSTSVSSHCFSQAVYYFVRVIFICVCMYWGACVFKLLKNSPTCSAWKLKLKSETCVTSKVESTFQRIARSYKVLQSLDKLGVEEAGGQSSFSGK